LKGTWDSDRDPLVALRAGDATLFEDFVRTESRTFLAFFRRLGATPAAAEDLVQDLFLKMFRHANTYQPSGKFQAFAFRIARNAWIDQKRRTLVRPKWGSGKAGDEDDAPEFDVPEEAPQPAAIVERKEEADRVLEALDGLSEGQRLVFELGVVQELPYSEISALLEIPEGTVKSRMFHAVRKLREILSEATDDAKSVAQKISSKSTTATPRRASDLA
jgi:RNA polymerase sigma-70 factor, ECF subfamily